MEGKGLYKSTNFTYEGDFVHGQQHGEGVLQLPDGVYTGAFDRGERQGHGKFEFKNKSVYVGEFANGMFHGVGVFTEPTGRVKKSVYNDGIVISALPENRNVVDLSSSDM
jgi:hypothetical protein